MPLINDQSAEQNFKSNPQTQGANGFNQGFKNQSNNFNQTNQTETPNQPKGLLTLPPALMQIIPWIPFAIEAISGQKVPAIGGTIGEIQSSLSAIQFSLQQILSQQQQIWNKLESLESNVSTQLTNLSQQVANTNRDFKLLATETKRSLEFSQSQNESET